MKQRVLVALSAEDMDLILFGCEKAMEYWDENALKFLKTDKKLSDNCRTLADNTQLLHKRIEQALQERIKIIIRRKDEADCHSNNS